MEKRIQMTQQDSVGAGRKFQFSLLLSQCLIHFPAIVPSDNEGY